MTWMFMRRSENSKRIIYRYSRGTEDLDGLIVYDKRTEEAFVFEPCRRDLDDYHDRDESLGHFFNYIVERSFPEVRRLVFPD